MKKVDKCASIPNTVKNKEYYQKLSWHERPAELMVWYYKRTHRIFWI